MKLAIASWNLEGWITLWPERHSKQLIKWWVKLRVFIIRSSIDPWVLTLGLQVVVLFREVSESLERMWDLGSQPWANIGLWRWFLVSAWVFCFWVHCDMRHPSITPLLVWCAFTLGRKVTQAHFVEGPLPCSALHWACFKCHLWSPFCWPPLHVRWLLQESQCCSSMAPKPASGRWHSAMENASVFLICGTHRPKGTFYPSPYRSWE